MSRIWPIALQPGSPVALVAPSGPLSADRIAWGIEQLQSWELDVRPGKHLYAKHPKLSYLAGDDRDRADDLMDAWTDPEISAIWCARGGYGAQRTIELLDLDRLRTAGPKHLIGFSDITALHARVGRELNQITVHGPVGTGRQLADQPSADSLRRLLFGPPESGTVLITGETMRPGITEGRLIGGNLALITDDIGVEPAPAEPSILIIEDIGEGGYRLDRMLTQLRRTGWLAQVRGVVLGDFTDVDDAALVAEVLLDRLGDLDVPVIRNAPFGHADRNIALPLGAHVRLDAGAGTLALS